MPISVVQQSESVTHIYIFFNIFYTFLLWFITGYWIEFPVLSILFASANPKLPVLPSSTCLPNGNCKPVLYVCESVAIWKNGLKNMLGIIKSTYFCCQIDIPINIWNYLNMFFFGGKFNAQIQACWRFHAIQIYAFSTSN